MSGWLHEFLQLTSSKVVFPIWRDLPTRASRIGFLTRWPTPSLLTTKYEFEAFADVTLTKEKGGTWTVPPFFIDSVAHLAGFVMNVSDADDVKNNFCVTPGWQFMRFARPLVAGNKYRSYVKMSPTAEDSNVCLGDVYVLQDGVIVWYSVAPLPASPAQPLLLRSRRRWS